LFNVEVSIQTIKTKPMKKVTRSVVFLAVTLTFLSAGLLFAGKPFEGVITYKISYPDSKFTESQLAMFPKLLTVSIKAPKSKTEISTSMGNQVEIVDYTDKSKVGLINMMGQKYAIKQTWEDIQKENADEPKSTVVLSPETKTIAGYVCKKAIVTVDDDGQKTTFEVYYNNEIGNAIANFDNPVYKDIDGVLMEYSMKTPQFTMKFSVTDVAKKSVSAKEFEIPADYTITTKEELKSKFGGKE
jgi:hypothetical protein